MLTIRYLGPVEISVDSSAPPAELLWRKNLALLIYLARSPRGRTREHLVGVLWPDKDDAKARHSLNEALRVLRRSLGAALQTEGETIRLAPDAVRSDVDHLGQLDLTAIGAPFLEGFALGEAPAFEDWLANERRALLTAQLDVLNGRADLVLRQGATSVARELALAALRLDPHHELSARLAMKACVLGGDRAQALRIFEALKQALRELGLQPDQATRALADRVGTERVYRGATHPVAGGLLRWPLAGRARDQLARLSALWEAMRIGAARGARAVSIAGDPGTGKTRLLDEIAARATLDGALVVRTRAADGPLRDSLAAFVRGGLVVAELGGAAPEVLAALIAIDPDVALRFPAARVAHPLPLEEAVLAAVQAIAEVRPVVFILDDAHRARGDILAELGKLLERCRGLPVLVIVASARAASEGVDRFAERVGRDLPGESFLTGPFSGVEIAEVVSEAFPGYTTAQHTRLVRRVLVDTAGNPFLAMELIRAVREGLNLPAAPSSWPSASHTLDDTRPGDLPESVAAALRLRFRSLTEPAQRTLAAVAVLGGALAEPVLGRVADVSIEELHHALDELEWNHWLIGDRSGYEFAIGLAREVVLADMVTGGQQRRMRERAAG